MITQVKNKVRIWTQASRLQPTALSEKPFVSLKRQVFTVDKLLLDLASLVQNFLL